MKKLKILVFILISSSCFGQDWNSWAFSYKFKINTKTTVNEVLNLEFYINDPHYSLNNLSRDKNIFAIKYDSIKSEYNLNLGYGCISCGYSKANEPPDIYIKVSLKDFRIENPFSIFIPIYTERVKNHQFGNNERKLDSEYEWVEETDIGEIHLAHFVDGYIIENGKTLPPYEAIEIKTDKSVHKRRKNEYELRLMNKFVELKLEE